MNGQILKEEGEYSNGYACKWFCEECGWFGAEFTGSICYSHKSRIGCHRHGKFVEKGFKEGKCDMCGKEGRVGWPWAFGTPPLATYLWGPDFIKKGS